MDFKHPFKMIGIIKRENSQKRRDKCLFGRKTINKQKVKKMEVKGLSKENIITISNYKGEEDSIREYPLRSFEQFTLKYE